MALITWPDRDSALPSGSPARQITDDIFNEIKNVVNENQNGLASAVASAVNDLDLLDDAITDGVTTKAPSQNAVADALALKQATLVSGTNIRTIQGTPILGSGDITLISDGISDGSMLAPTQNIVFDALALKATIAYVDDVASGLVDSWKDSVRLKTTGNVTLSGEQTIDGELTSADDVLVASNTDATENGIYTTAAGAWSRRADSNTGVELEGAAVTVLEGTLNANTNWLQHTDNITLGTSNIVWGPLGQNASDATPTNKGIARLYIVTGSNTDGSMDQNSITQALALKANLISPSFTTPALGTPSSGVGTNITGIVAANVVNTPDGNIAATTVQAAINELDGEKVALTSFVDGEVPSGTMNSSNQTFTIANTPIAGSVQVFWGGQKLRVGVGYTISGTTLTMTNPPDNGDILEVYYRK